MQKKDLTAIIIKTDYGKTYCYSLLIWLVKFGTRIRLCERERERMRDISFGACLMVVDFDNGSLIGRIIIDVKYTHNIYIFTDDSL